MLGANSAFVQRGKKRNRQSPLHSFLIFTSQQTVNPKNKLHRSKARMQEHLSFCRTTCVTLKMRELQPPKLETDSRKILLGKHLDLSCKSLPEGGGGFATRQTQAPA
jgi:hypothetical protein